MTKRTRGRRNDRARRNSVRIEQASGQARQRGQQQQQRQQHHKHANERQTRALLSVQRYRAGGKGARENSGQQHKIGEAFRDRVSDKFCRAERSPAEVTRNKLHFESKPVYFEPHASPLAVRRIFVRARCLETPSHLAPTHREKHGASGVLDLGIVLFHHRLHLRRDDPGEVGRFTREPRRNTDNVCNTCIRASSVGVELSSHKSTTFVSQVDSSNITDEITPENTTSTGAKGSLLETSLPHPPAVPPPPPLGDRVRDVPRGGKKAETSIETYLQVCCFCFLLMSTPH